MKLIKNISFFIFLFALAVGCKKDVYNDTSFVNAAAASSNLSVLFEITQDNSGLVTITPNGVGAESYDIYFGDATTGFTNIAAGKNITHIYAEGIYTVKIVAHDIKGGTTTFTQQLTVSFRTPQNFKVNLNTSGLAVSLSASALYETYFKVFYGDSTTTTPEPFTAFLEGQTVSHTYKNAGTYIVRIVALSGGAATATILDTIHVANQINLPVTFEDVNTDYTMSDFGGNISTLVADPANASNHVMKSVKTSGAQTWAGTTIGTGLGFATPIPLTNTNSRMTVMVYSPAIGLHIRLKVEDHNDATHSVETEALTTVVNQWETLTFDFKNQATGTAAFNTSYIYDKASIFFDFNNVGNGKTYYFDNVKMAPPPLTQINIPINFESTTTDYTMSDFGGNTTSLVADPINASNHVMKSIKTAGAQTWAGTTIGTVNGFSQKIPVSTAALKMTVKVYSPAIGLDIKLKLDNHANPNVGLSVETDVLTTVANQWETLTFDFSQPASGTPAWNAANTYDLASIFFDFNIAGTGKVFYWDEVHFLSQINLPVNFNNPDMDPTVNDFGGNSSNLIIDPAPAHSTGLVMKSIKTSGAQVWAGTNISSLNAAQTLNNGFASNIVFTAASQKMTVDVYAPAAGIDVKLKLDNKNNSNTGLSVETDALTTAAGWQTLTFDFSHPASGTPAWNAANTYNLASIFFDFGNAGTGSAFYWNNIIKL